MKKTTFITTPYLNYVGNHLLKAEFNLSMPFKKHALEYQFYFTKVGANLSGEAKFYSG